MENLFCANVGVVVVVVVVIVVDIVVVVVWSAELDMQSSA